MKVIARSSYWPAGNAYHASRPKVYHKEQQSGQRRLAGFHQILQPTIPLFSIQLSNIITRHSYQQAMATRSDVVRTINNPSLRVVGGLLRRLPIEVDEHYIFHIKSPFIMHSAYSRLPFGP